LWRKDHAIVISLLRNRRRGGLTTRRAFATADFVFSAQNQNQAAKFMKVRFGGTPKPARETVRYLIDPVTAGLGGGLGRGLGVV